MIKIEKHRFLAELGRLLTFMFEEDRRTALSMYEDMFDRTENPEQLMKLLVSPTRQAVIIARVYNAREYDMAVRSRSGEGDADVEVSSVPGFVKEIEAVAEKAEALFPRRNTYETVWEDEEEPNVPEHFEEYDFSEPENGEADPGPTLMSDPAPDVPENSAVEDPFAFVNTDFSGVISGTFGEFPVGTEETPDESREEEVLSEEERSRRIDSYMAAFAESAEEQTEKESFPDPVEEPRPAAGGRRRAERAQSWKDINEAEGDGEDGSRSRHSKSSDRKSDRRKKEQPSDLKENEGELSILLVVLYVILAVPLTAVGVLLLLLPAVLFLAIFMILVSAGAQAITTAFGGFAVFADIMVVLGGALVVISVGLFALWIFFWFIGGAIVGLINGAIRLGGRFCTVGGDGE